MIKSKNNILEKKMNEYIQKINEGKNRKDHVISNFPPDVSTDEFVI